MMIYRSLGSTGEKVSAIGLGGWHLGLKNVDEQLAIRIVRTAIDRGINFLDNCWDYNEGASEVRMGKAIRDGYREKAFLMTKIDGRSKKEATRQLDHILLVTGIAASITESISMGAVAYTSFGSDRDFYLAEKRREQDHVSSRPEEEREEIKEIYAAK